MRRKPPRSHHRPWTSLSLAAGCRSKLGRPAVFPALATWRHRRDWKDAVSTLRGTAASKRRGRSARPFLERAARLCWKDALSCRLHRCPQRRGACSAPWLLVGCQSLLRARRGLAPHRMAPRLVGGPAARPRVTTVDGFKRWSRSADPVAQAAGSRYDRSWSICRLVEPGHLRLQPQGNGPTL